MPDGKVICNDHVSAFAGNWPYGRSQGSSSQMSVFIFINNKLSAARSFTLSLQTIMKYVGGLALITNLVIAAGAQRAAQVPLHIPTVSNAGLQPNATAFGASVQRLELASLSSDDFTVAGHQSFPSHQVRVKRVKDFCDPTVK